MMEHSCQGMTLGDHSKAICTICGADLSKPAFNELLEAIQRVRELAEKFEQEPDNEMVSYHLAARRIFTALDGEQ